MTSTTTDMNFHPDETVTLNDRFRGSTGAINPHTRGIIVETKDGLDQIVSVSFGHTPEIFPNEKTWINITPETFFGFCYEGPLIKLWWDLDGEHHLSTTNKLDCRNSYWGNKEERFGNLFYKHGGQKFIEECSQNKNLTHHFMILTKDLAVTTDLKLRNDCYIAYLGSMDRGDCIFSMIDYDTDIFQQDTRPFNYTPDVEDIGFINLESSDKILYPQLKNSEYYLDNIDRAKDILYYGIHNYTLSNIFDPLTEDERMRGVDMRLIRSYFGEPVIARNSFGITKFLPEGYLKKCEILGNSPNIKLLVYNLMDDCRPKRDITLDYFNKYDFFFVPHMDFIKYLKNPDYPVKEEIIKKYRELGTIGYMDAKNFKTTRCRERNLMMVLLLCLPQSKAKEAIEAYEEFLETQEKLIKFVTANIQKVFNGKYDEEIKNPKVMMRLKDICQRSRDYASKSIMYESEYREKFTFSLKGLVHNERGSSLYRISRELNKLLYTK